MVTARLLGRPHLISRAHLLSIAVATAACFMLAYSSTFIRARRRRRKIALSFARDGFVSPLHILSPDEAAAALAALEVYEVEKGGMLRGDERFKLHLLFPWAAKLVRNPQLTEAVAAALGTDNLLVWSSDINSKPAYSQVYASAHQDSTYAKLDPADGALTAWLALSDAPRESGPLAFVAGSHCLGQIPHTETRAVDNLLSLGQCAVGYDDECHRPHATIAELKAGEASLHAFRTVHWSGPNLSARRRVGLAIRYVRADIGRAKGTTRESATLARGRYEPAQGAFELEAEPQTEAGDAERASHAAAMLLERKNYFGGCGDGANVAYK